MKIQFKKRIHLSPGQRKGQKANYIQILKPYQEVQSWGGG